MGDIKTFEIFTDGFSVVLQKENIYIALKHFGREYHYPEVIAVIEHERGQEFINSKNNCAIPVVSESKMPRTIFIDGESVEEMHSINTLIRFAKGEGVRLHDILYEVESVDIDLDNNIINVWLDTIK